MADFSTTVVTQVTQAVVLSTVQQVVQVNSAIPGNYLSAPRLGFGIYSVKDPVYGATGDGVTDDTAAIQAALNACSAAGGGITYAPQGTYNYTHLTVPANVTLEGAGRGVTTLYRTALGPEVGGERLFGVRLTGNFAGLRNLSCRGLWNPLNPTVQTFDFNIQVMGDNVTHTFVENVETYNAHLGYNVGGVIGNAASYGGQNYNTVGNCYAHDTYDLGFGFVAKDRTTGTSHGCSIINSRATDSYSQAGMEIRFQTGTQVLGFYAEDCTNVNGGAGIRLEETNNVLIQGFHATNCGFGLEVVNDSHSCTITGFYARDCQYGTLIGNSADITINGFGIDDSDLDGISVAPNGAAGTWTRNNERITLQNGYVDTTGVTGTGYGIEVFGTFTAGNGALVTNGSDLRVLAVTVKNTPKHGILIQAGGRFQLDDVTVMDCGDGTSTYAGITVVYPTVNGVDDTTAPLNGIVDNITFVNTGVMPRPWLDANHLVYQGRFRFIGSFANLPTLQTGGDLNTRFLVRYDANQAAGLHLYNTTTGFPAPRFFSGNLADGTGGAIYANGNTWIFTLGVTPDGSGGSGAAAMSLTPTALFPGSSGGTILGSPSLPFGDITATGGFRQTIDGWNQDNVVANQTNVELVRATGRFRAARAGSITGLVVTATEARTAGILTVTVFKNTGLAGATGSSIGLTAVLDGSNTSRKATTQNKDAETFAVGDEIYAVVTTDSSWLPVTSDIRVAIEIED